MAGGSDQKLAVELLALLALQTARGATTGKMPHPRSYVAGLTAFAILSGVGKISPAAQRLANIMGGVLLLGYVFSWLKADPTALTKVFAIPANVASGKGFPTKPTTPTPHKGITILGELVELLAAGAALRSLGGLGSGGGSGGGEGEGEGGGGGTGGEEPGATVGELTPPEIEVGP